MEITYKLSEIDTIAEKLITHTKHRTILFYGEMGAGKTTLIKSLVKALGAEDTASSPTFSLVNVYSTPNGMVNHFDFYRIEDETEALDMGIEEYLEADAWNFIEWPQNIQFLLGEDFHIIELKAQEGNHRKLKFS